MLARMMSDPPVARQLLQLPYVTEAHWRQRILDMPSGAGSAELFLVAERDGDVVGHAGLTPVPGVRRRHAMGMGMSVAAHAQGQGVGRTLIEAVLDWADHWAQVLRIELTVYTDNERAIALYRGFGFQQEGVHRAYALRDGVFVDALAMARLHPCPPSLHGATSA